MSPSVEGNLLLDFLTQTVNFGTVNDKKNVTEVMQFWLDNSVVNDDAKGWFRENWELL